ncbi:MAG TPA: hypothetical protein VF649_12545 [Sphingomonas sp.]|jgi:hypothetical protein|uniref:hypothetical protein n=1 Tax=Sphingomonas sp. TaxID=28214 RepID=UPI002ED7E17B
MTSPTQSPQAAGGIFLAIGALAGALIGMRNGQPTLGLLIGFGLGLGIALALWLVQRRR